MATTLYNGLTALAGAFKGALLDRVSAATNGGSSLTVADPATGDSTVRVTLNSASCALRLPGSPAHVAFVAGRRNQTGVASITGDLDVRVKLSLTSWASGATQYLAHKDGGNPNRGWIFSLGSTGTLSLSWSSDGTSGAALTKTSTASVPFGPGQTGWLRVVFDVDNGATGNSIFFYTSRDGVTWTQLGTTVVTAGATSIFNNSTIDYYIGASVTTTNPLIGDLHYVDIRSGIAGTTVLPTDPTGWTTGTSGTQTAYAATTAAGTGTRLKLALTQDTTGGRKVAWPGNIIWPGMIAPTLSTLPGAVDAFEFDWTDGANWYARPLTQDTAASFARIDIQKFTSSGSWVKPAWASQVEFDAFGAGAGGGSGRRGAAGTARAGGGGGSGGNRQRQLFDAADLPPSVAVTVGTGGTGGAAIAVNDTNGANGTAGGNSSFGTYTKAYGGAAGVGGTAAAGTGGAATPGQMPGGTGGSSSITAQPGNASTLNQGAPGGGAGGGLSTADAEFAGGGAYSTSDNSNYNVFNGGGAGGGNATAQADRTPVGTVLSGVGGPGGGSCASAPGGTGAAGSKYGAGGGGGGATVNGNLSGAGGAGADGIVWIISRG